MEPAITVAVIAAAVSAVGWIVNYILTSRSERERTRLTSRLNHVEKQLEFLYGPLAFLVYEGRQTWEDLLHKLGRNHVFVAGHELPQQELDLWLFWVEHDFMPRNLTIKNLLASNAHLIDGAELPRSYIEFLNHHNSWQIQHQRWKEQDIEYSWHSDINWPGAFEDEVVSTFTRLMKEHETLIQGLHR
jgi:hypothetical protein